MNIKKITFCLCAIALASPLAGCSNTKEKLGLARQSPNEFAVVKRAPLSMPPDMALQSPQPGAPRPQEQATSEQAKETVFGSASGNAARSNGEEAFVARAGAHNANPAIRQQVDAETAKLSKENIPVARKLFGFGGDPDSAPVSVVNAKQEAERIQENKNQGKPVTTGQTPTVER